MYYFIILLTIGYSLTIGLLDKNITSQNNSFFYYVYLYFIFASFLWKSQKLNILLKPKPTIKIIPLTTIIPFILGTAIPYIGSLKEYHVFCFLLASLLISTYCILIDYTYLNKTNDLTLRGYISVYTSSFIIFWLITGNITSLLEIIFILGITLNFQYLEKRLS